MTVTTQTRDWDELIRDVVAGRWKDPATGQPARVPFEVIHLDDTLDGQEADLIGPLNLGKRLAVVSDVNTVEAMGRRVARALRAIATVDEIVLPERISCDEETIALVQERTRPQDRHEGHRYQLIRGGLAAGSAGTPEPDDEPTADTSPVEPGWCSAPVGPQARETRDVSLPGRLRCCSAVPSISRPCGERPRSAPSHR